MEKCNYSNLVVGNRYF